MFRSNWGDRSADLMQWGGGFVTFILCLVVTWLIAANYGEYNGYTKANSENSAISYSNLVQEACAGFARFDLVRCGYEVNKSAKESERTEINLQAQKELSLWTYWMMWASGGGIVLSMVGIYFLAANLNEMKHGRSLTERAVKTAQDQVTASLDANEIARNDQRPFIYIGGIQNNRRDENSVYNHLVWTFQITNHGRTPAKVQKVISEGQITIDWSGPTCRERVDDHKFFVGPSESASRSYTDMDFMSARGRALLDEAPIEIKNASIFVVDNQTDFRMARKNLLLRVQVIYTDIQRVMWETSGCWAESKAFRGIQEHGGDELNYQRRIR